MRLFIQTGLVSVLCAFSLISVAKNIAIVDATVHTMSSQGTLNNATVLIRDGKIESVVAQTPSIEGYEVIDGKNKVVTPGLIGAYTSLGLVEVGFSAGTNDSNVSKTMISNTGAALDVSYAVNSNSSLMGISRVDGLTSAATTMSNTNQLFQGLGAIISLGDESNPILKSTAFISTIVGNDGADDAGGSRAALWVALKKALSEAEFVAGKSFTPQSQWFGMSTVEDAKALAKVVSGEIPLMIEAHREADLRQVIALKQRRPSLNVVVLQATEGWRVANELAQANIPVILNPESNLPYEFDQLAATLQNAARLNAAGVVLAIGMNTHNIRLATQHAGNAVSHGLPWEAGLAALTSHPAKIYGVSDRIGSLEKGKQADVVVWSGDPLEVTETALTVIINGQVIDMQSRQTKLRDRYLSIPKNTSVHYQRP